DSLPGWTTRAGLLTRHWERMTMRPRPTRTLRQRLFTCALTSSLPLVPGAHLLAQDNQKDNPRQGTAGQRQPDVAPNTVIESPRTQTPGGTGWRRAYIPP